MSKLSYILITLILGLLLAIGVTLYIKNKPTLVIENKVTYTDSSVILPSTTGSPVEVTNFLKDPAVIADAQNPGLYFVGNTFLKGSDNSVPTYVVTYEEKNGYFNIALLVKPLARARFDAEKYLENFLNIDENSLCSLSYTVSVPGYVDEAASGIDYRFSFCPDNVPL